MFVVFFRLIVKKADLDHEGDYTCIASNEVDTCSSHCEMLVEELPSSLRFKKQLSDSEIVPNKEVELSIEIEGLPSVEGQQPSVIWFKDEVPVQDISKDGATSKYEMDLKEGRYTLKFTPTGVEDEGNYKVVVKNNEGQSSSVAKLKIPEGETHTEARIQRLEIQQDFEFPEVTFEIKNEPEFVSVPRDITVNENDKVVLRCSVAGNPVPEIKWFNEKKEEIPEQGRVRHETKDGYSSLIIDDADLNDEGIYTCTASNPSGEVSTTVELLVDEVQPDIQPLAKPGLGDIPVIVEEVDRVYMEPAEKELR